MSRSTILLAAFLIPIITLVNFINGLDTQAATSATFTVNNSTDAVDVNPGDGICETSSSNAICTLRAAIQESNANPGLDIIILPSATYTLTLAGANEDQSATGDLDIVDDLSIVGDSPTNTFIDGNELDRVFHITGTKPVSISFRQITIQNGNTTTDNSLYCGAGMLISSSNATVNMTSTAVFNNKSTTCGHGISNEGTLNVENSQFSKNSVIAGGGGTLFNVGNLTVKNSTFDDNYSYGGAGVFNEGTAALDNVTLINNVVYLDGGAIYNSGTLSITGGIIATNTVNTFYGGGIYQANGNLYLNNVLIHNNTVPIQNGGFDTYGGGLYIAAGQAAITNTTFMNNRAEFGGAVTNKTGNVTIANSNIYSNMAADGGGGIVNENEMYLMNSSVISNVAGTEGGGGLLNSGAAALITVTNTTIGRNLSGTNGGAINNQASGAVWLNNVTIAQNGNGIFNNGATISIENSIIAYHINNNCSGTVTSAGHNLDDDNSCNFSETGDVFNVDPQLFALDFDSMKTWTYQLPENSPAIDSANNSSCSEVDQLFTNRPLDGNKDDNAVCDMGAYEAAPIYELFLPSIIK